MSKPFSKQTYGHDIVAALLPFYKFSLFDI